jgi:membrane protein involved in colicin uptake
VGDALDVSAAAGGAGAAGAVGESYGMTSSRAVRDELLREGSYAALVSCM